MPSRINKMCFDKAVSQETWLLILHEGFKQTECVWYFYVLPLSSKCKGFNLADASFNFYLVTICITSLLLFNYGTYVETIAIAPIVVFFFMNSLYVSFCLVFTAPHLWETELPEVNLLVKIISSQWPSRTTNFISDCRIAEWCHQD